MRESLLDFRSRQARCVTFVGAHLARKFQYSRGVYDVEAGAEEAIRTYPVLKGVSARELLAEVLAPGTFEREVNG